jgi:uncharacterized BrkB/YihY/UPF0761 family membrane protein
MWEVHKLNRADFPGPRSFELFKIIQTSKKNSAAAAEMLKSLRKSLKTEDHFNKMCNSALSQLYAQMAFILLFYIAVLSAVVRQGLHKAYPGFVFASVALYLIGNAVVWYLPRNIK